MLSRTTKDCAWLVLAVAATRYLFRTETPYLLDSINFILGVTEFDPARHQPHPPGYYLYIQTVRLLQFVWSDPHTALVALSAELTGMDAFEEIVNVEDLSQLRDPLKERLLELARQHAPELV